LNREVFLIADDFGITRDANRAIVRAHCEGALHGASLMMGQAATDDAVVLARENPTLQIGWHLHLCRSKPVTCATWPWGDSHTKAGWAIGLQSSARELMRREVYAQWELFRATRLSCAFVNSHHHMHAHPLVYVALLEVMPSDFAGWLRIGAPHCFSPTIGDNVRAAIARAQSAWRRPRCPFRASDTLWGADRTFRMRANEVRAAIMKLPPGLHEFMFHPRNVEHDHDFAALMELKAQ